MLMRKSVRVTKQEGRQMMLFDIIIKSQKDLLNNARVIGMWELLLKLNEKNLLSPGESRAIRETIKELEGKYVTATH